MNSITRSENLSRSALKCIINGWPTWLRPALWAVVVLLGSVALGFQALATHRDNLVLRDQMHRVEREGSRLEAENRRMRGEMEALQSDPHYRDMWLRHHGRIHEGERIIHDP